MIPSPTTLARRQQNFKGISSALCAIPTPGLTAFQDLPHAGEATRRAAIAEALADAAGRLTRASIDLHESTHSSPRRRLKAVQVEVTAVWCWLGPVVRALSTPAPPTPPSKQARRQGGIESPSHRRATRPTEVGA